MALTIGQYIEPGTVVCRVAYRGKQRRPCYVNDRLKIIRSTGIKNKSYFVRRIDSAFNSMHRVDTHLLYTQEEFDELYNDWEKIEMFRILCLTK